MRDLQRDRPVFNEVWAERFGEHRPGPVGDRVLGVRPSGRERPVHDRGRGLPWLIRRPPTVPNSSRASSPSPAAGFGEPPRHPFRQRCEAAAAAGFAGIGLHVDDLARTAASGLDAAGMRAVLDRRPVCAWSRSSSSAAGRWTSTSAALAATAAGVEAVADALGGRHVSAGEFRPAQARPRRRRGTAGRARRPAGRARAAGGPGGVPVVGAARRRHRRRAAAAGRLGQRRADDRRLALLQRGRRPRRCSTDLPGAGVVAVQLNDGPRVHADFLRHARAARRLPGVRRARRRRARAGGAGRPGSRGRGASR